MPVKIAEKSLSVMKINLYSKDHELLACGYKRIVVGERGMYLEFKEKDLLMDNFFVPEYEEWRLKNNKCYYIEYRSHFSNIKCYFQKKRVWYADYKIGYYYISALDVFTRKNKVLTTFDRF